jgi:hypothetical protein
MEFTPRVRVRARARAVRARKLSSEDFTASCRENFLLVAVHVKMG